MHQGGRIGHQALNVRFQTVVWNNSLSGGLYGCPGEGPIVIQIENLKNRARSFRRRAEWMTSGVDRDRIIAMAAQFDADALSLTTRPLTSLA